ncbi:60S ribosomal protein L7 [Culex quinquefasciatus]|uniref:60S ribosomal protein L7 n=2 Tax=Culex quinquefasciatus TaxID=7176 RepID=B0W5S9_CULQU|nr:60S ribosomal protein L7 [Culex quinquefasciatus]|eukprot:XP_001844063.1 60S ribosomal protein L7 [Culex quinquefasciatus]
MNVWFHPKSPMERMSIGSGLVGSCRIRSCNVDYLTHKEPLTFTSVAGGVISLDYVCFASAVRPTLRPTFFLDVTLIVPLVHIPNEISALHGGRFGSSRVECWNEWNEVLETGNRLRSKESLKLPVVPESKLKATRAKLLAHPENCAASCRPLSYSALVDKAREVKKAGNIYIPGEPKVAFVMRICGIIIKLNKVTKNLLRITAPTSSRATPCLSSASTDKTESRLRTSS